MFLSDPDLLSKLGIIFAVTIGAMLFGASGAIKISDKNLTARSPFVILILLFFLFIVIVVISGIAFWIYSNLKFVGIIK